MYWLRSKIHPTWQLTVICAGLVIGVTLALIWHGFTSWLWLALGGALCTVAIWKSRRVLLVAALLGGMLVGLYRGSVDQTLLAYYAPYISKTVSLKGVIDDDPTLTGTDTYALHLKNVRINGSSQLGIVYVTVGEHGASVRRSDEVEVKGALLGGFGNFSATMYRASLVSATRQVPGDVALEIRDGFADKVRQGIEEPSASLGIGFLLGQKSALPSHLVEALQIAGLTHIVVASGYNLMILVRLAKRLFERVSRYIATLVSASLIIGFITITGLTPSMTRAGLVAGLGIAAWYVGRKFHPVTLLLFAAAITVMFEPSNVWGNVGWMLSFAAFAGVMLVAPIFTAYFFGKDKVPFMAQLFIETSSAQLVTLPIITAVFGQLSIIALLANLLILPLIPLAMLLTFIAGLAGFVVPALQSITAWPAQELLSLIVRVVEWCASLPGAQIQWQASVAIVIAAYSVLIAACFYMKWRVRYNLHTASVVD
ncbi:MAG: ComEC/Rec2 family competence protein [Candidatus Saccharimonas sp.]